MSTPESFKLTAATDARTRRVRHALRLLESLDPKRLDDALGHCGTLAGKLGFQSTAAHNELRSLLEVGKAALERSRAQPAARAWRTKRASGVMCGVVNISIPFGVRAVYRAFHFLTLGHGQDNIRVAGRLHRPDSSPVAYDRYPAAELRRQPRRPG